MNKKTILFAGLLFLLAGVFFFLRLAEEANMGGNAVELSENPALMEISGVNMRHGEKGRELWLLKADAAVMSRHDGGIVAHNPLLTYYYNKKGRLPASGNNGGVIVVRSDSGEVNQQDNRIGFIGQVLVSREQDLLETSRIVYEGKESRLICPQPSKISRPGLRGTADEMVVNLEDNTWHARKNVRVEFDTRRSLRRGGRP